MTVTERYEEFLRRASDIAKELHLEIEYTRQQRGSGYMPYDVTVAEIVTTDTFEYAEIEGSTCLPR